MDPNYVKQTKQFLPELTKGLRKVANQLLVDPMIFAIHPAKKVGEIIGVSETMVIRFCHHVGYAGYSELQSEVRLHLLDLNRNPVQEIQSEDRPLNRFIKNMTDDTKHLKANIDHVDVNAMDEAVEFMINSHKVVVAGYYHSFTFAHWFYYGLNYILGNAALYRPESDAGLLDLLPKHSCVVVFSFFRYALDTIRLAEEAKKKGIKVIAITDSWVSPVTEQADIVIPLKISDNQTLINKGPVTLSVLNALLIEIINRNKNSGKIKATYKYFIKEGEQ